MEGVIVDETLFEAYLKCEAKFYFKSVGKVGSDIEFTNYKKELCRKYKEEGQQRLCDTFGPDECFAGTPSISEFRRRQYQLIVGSVLQKAGIRSHVHALERMDLRGSQKAAQYVPIRFVPTEKVNKADKLLLAFDGLVVSSYLGKEPSFGKIIHGSEHSIIKVRLPELSKTIRSFINEVGPNEPYVKPPNVILNKHCAECEFQSQCQKTAVEKDDLSLLSRLSAKERDNLHKKGIFTVTQLSYTFRPRRRPKRSTSKRTRYYHSLRALAVREQKTFIVDRPQLDIAGTPVYLDVEGIPDRDFYYLIGLRFKKNGEFIQTSLWANNSAEERAIWCEFLQGLSQIDRPVLVHYGSYETHFLKQMKERYGESTMGSDFLENLIADSLNLLSTIYAQVYFPTYSNGLKDIAQHLGFSWSSQRASGANALLWRHQWEHTHAAFLMNRIITYNAEDCEALNRVTDYVRQLCSVFTGLEGPRKDNTVHTDSMKRHSPYRFGKNEFATPEMEYINRCAYWDYQHEKVYVKSNDRLKRTSKKRKHRQTRRVHIDKIIQCPPPRKCPKCNSMDLRRESSKENFKVIYDLKFMYNGLKRWTTKYIYQRYVCRNCRKTLYPRPAEWSRGIFGPNLRSYIAYQVIELCLPLTMVRENTNRLFGLTISQSAIRQQKVRASEYYKITYDAILRSIIKGSLIQADETKINVKGKDAYVWVLTNLDEVVYIYSETREGDMMRSLLEDFAGVLISDFYAAYDSIECIQQKCLIHLIRDLNDDIFKEPFNEELKKLAREFSCLLKPMIETVDRYGLKSHFLRKHKVAVDRFYRGLTEQYHQPETVVKYRKRLIKYRKKLFTFLDYDGVPWNNNNAEHAIKAFAKLRKEIDGLTSDIGIQEYLILLSIHETCKCKGIDFLQFLCSGQRDIDEFLNSKHRR